LAADITLVAGCRAGARLRTARHSADRCAATFVATRCRWCADSRLVLSRGARFSVPPWASVHGSRERAEARSSTLKRAPLFLLDTR
jgi:hypothetical protein